MGYYVLRPKFGTKPGRIEPSAFFAWIKSLLPTVTTICFEGSSITLELQAIYRMHALEGRGLHERQTIWPRAQIWQCVCSLEFVTQLIKLSDEHAAPEICDHLSVWSSQENLLEWPDAFHYGSVPQVSDRISPQAAGDLARLLNLDVSWGGIQGQTTN